MSPSGSVAAWLPPRQCCDLDTVRHGPGPIATRLVRCMAAGARAVFCDAETDHDIEEIARGALAVRHRHGVAILPVDPGPFTATLVRLMKQPRRLSPLVFGIVGSVMDTSRRQMDFVEAGGCAFTVRYDGRERAPTARRRSSRRRSPPRRCCCGPTPRRSMPPANCGFTTCWRDLFEQVVEQFPSLGGFVLSGGETAGRLLAGCGVRSLRMVGEVMPLIALSQIEDGGLAGRYLVTKGGTVGTTSAIADALGRLYDVIADDPPGVAARRRTGQRGDVLVPG